MPSLAQTCQVRRRGGFPRAAILPDAWGSGAGQLLIERAHEVLAERFDEAVLTVLAANPRARRFYERNGWTLDELRTEPHFGGEPTDVARYRKRL